MSRNIKFMSCEKNSTLKGVHSYRQYSCLFIALGYSKVKNSGYFRIGGCGMDMIFNTNYNNIHHFKHLGFIDKDQCAKLAQMTPTTI